MYKLYIIVPCHNINIIFVMTTIIDYCKGIQHHCCVCRDFTQLIKFRILEYAIVFIQPTIINVYGRYKERDNSEKYNNWPRNKINIIIKD